MNTCSTCKHWGCEPILDDVRSLRGRTIFEDTHRTYSDDGGVVDTPIPTARLCVCPHVHQLNNEQEAVNDPDSCLDGGDAFVQDGSGYMSLFFTQPDFGCVCYESK